jgi:hypothetical protein
MAEEGWAPNLPIILVPGAYYLLFTYPFIYLSIYLIIYYSFYLFIYFLARSGFGSTSLEVVEGYEKWKGQRVWLSLSKISREALSFRSVRPLPRPGPTQHTFSPHTYHRTRTRTTAHAHTAVASPREERREGWM